MQTNSFRRAGHLPSLVGALVHFETSFFVWVLLGAVGAYVAADLGLSPFQKGLMVAVPPLGGACFRLVLGTLTDRVGAKRTGLLSLALTIVPLLWGWLAGDTYAQVLGLGLLLGVAGASFAVALPLASRWYPPQYQGLALGIAGAGNSGTVLAAFVAPRVAERLGWHAVFGLATLPVALAWLAFAVLVREPPMTRSPSDNRTGSPLAMLAEPDARWFCWLYMATFGGFVGLSGYLPVFFVDRFGLAKATGALLAGGCAASGSLLRPVGGAVADRFGGLHVLVGVFAAVAAAAAVLGPTGSLPATTVLLVLVVGSLGIGNGAVFQLVPQRFGSRMGAVTGLVGAAGGVGGFLLPFGLGALRQATGSFAPGFLAVAAVATAAGVAVRRRQRTWDAAPLPLQVAA